MASSPFCNYDQWLTTQPEWTTEVPPLKCSTCGRFVSRKVLLRSEAWESGWDCDGVLLDCSFVWCDNIHDDARRCWQDGWSQATIDAHVAQDHKLMEYHVTKCGEAAAHAAHHVVENSGTTDYYLCSAGHEAKEVTM
jgi:hypothetical protein